MKRLLLTLAIVCSPLVADAFAVPWFSTSTSQGSIQPVPVNGTYQSIQAPYYVASSTTATSSLPVITTNSLSVTGFVNATVLPLQDTYANLSSVVASSGQMVYFTDRKDQAVGDGSSLISALPFVPVTNGTYTWTNPQTYSALLTLLNNIFFNGTSSAALSTYSISIGTTTSNGNGVGITITSSLASTSASNQQNNGVTGGKPSGSINLNTAAGFAITGATTTFVSGGASGAISIQTGAGGNELQTNTANNNSLTGGNSGGISLTTGVGGNATSTGNGSALPVGGNSGAISMITSAGGNMLQGGGNGGNSGNIAFQTGQGGSASGADYTGAGNQSGNSGNITFITGNTPLASGSTVFDAAGQPGMIGFIVGTPGAVSTNPQAGTQGSPISFKAGDANTVTGFYQNGGNVYASAGAGSSGQARDGALIVGYYIANPNLPFNTTPQYTALSVGSTSPTGSLTVVGTSSSQYPYTIYASASGNTTQFVVKSNGNVGIGTTNPANLLYVSGSLDNNTDAAVLKTTNSSGIASLGLLGSTGNRAALFKNSPSYVPYKNTGSNDMGIYNSTAGGNMSFLNDSGSGNINFDAGGASAAQMFLSSTGNLGIGTSSPYAPLSVVGQIVGAYFTGTTTASSTFGGGISISGQNALQLTDANGTGTYFGWSNVNTPYFAITGVPSGSFLGGLAGTSASQLSFNSSTGFGLASVSTPGDSSGNGWKLKAFGPTGNILIGDLAYNTAETNYKLNINTAGSAGYFAISNGTTGNIMSVLGSGFVGLATTTPWRTLSVNGSSDLGTNALAGYFTATSSTSSSFAGGLTAYASSTIGNGAQTGGLTVNGGATTTGTLTVKSSSSLDNGLVTTNGSGLLKATNMNVTNQYQVNNLGITDSVGDILFNNTHAGIQDTSASFGANGSVLTSTGSGPGASVSWMATSSLSTGFFPKATTASISGAIVGIGCDSADTVSPVTISSTTVFSTTPQTFPGAGLSWYSYALNSTTFRTSVCSDVTITPTASTYNVAIMN